LRVADGVQFQSYFARSPAIAVEESAQSVIEIGRRGRCQAKQKRPRDYEKAISAVSYAPH